MLAGTIKLMIGANTTGLSLNQIRITDYMSTLSTVINTSKQSLHPIRLSTFLNWVIYQSLLLLKVD